MWMLIWRPLPSTSICMASPNCVYKVRFWLDYTAAVRVGSILLLFCDSNVHSVLMVKKKFLGQFTALSNHVSQNLKLSDILRLARLHSTSSWITSNCNSFFTISSSIHAHSLNFGMHTYTCMMLCVHWRDADVTTFTSKWEENHTHES